MLSVRVGTDYYINWQISAIQFLYYSCILVPLLFIFFLCSFSVLFTVFALCSGMHCTKPNYCFLFSSLAFHHLEPELQEELKKKDQVYDYVYFNKGL
jgi:hypothetical protein